MKIKKVPLRMCTGCLEMKSKRELMRIVKNKDGDVSIDFTGKKPGRGAYLCNNISCLEKSIKSRKIEKSLEITINEDLYNKLKDEILKNAQ